MLGLIPSLTGTLFGKVSNHPVSFFIVGNACIIAGLSFFDIINISFTRIRLQNKIKKSGGYFSALLLGLTSGLVVGPCLAPALATILLIVAGRQNIIYGASLLFVFAYGVGFLLILIGTFSGLFLSFTKSEIWLLRIKKIGGFILIGIGEYFLIKAGRSW
jgi:thiol:disulfide interchange protein DsbD